MTLNDIARELERIADHHTNSGDDYTAKKIGDLANDLRNHPTNTLVGDDDPDFVCSECGRTGHREERGWHTERGVDFCPRCVAIEEGFQHLDGGPKFYPMPGEYR